MKTPCKSYESFEKADSSFFKGDLDCLWFAPGIFERVRLACTKKRGKYFKKVCPWRGRPDSVVAE